MQAKPAKRLGGLVTALITPFDERGKVDVDRLGKLVDFQVSKGAGGIFACGSTGLGPLLGLEERKVVASAVVEAAAKRVPVVIQVGSADTASTVELASHAQEAGADAVASLTPYYYKPGEKAVAKHFEAVSRAVGLPVFAYNIPQFTGNNLQPNLVAALAKQGVITGLKDSSRDLLQLLDVLSSVPDGFVVFNGTEEYGLFAMMSGADGLVSGGASAVPELFASMVGALQRGDYKEANSQQARIGKFKGLVRAAQIPSYYAILRARGIDCGSPRPPFLPLSAGEGADLLAELSSMGFI